MNSTGSHVRLMCVPAQHDVAMDMTISGSAMIYCASVRGVQIHSDCMQVAASRQRYVIISNLLAVEAQMTNQMNNRCVYDVTTTRPLMMAARGGESKSLYVMGTRPGGQSCVCTREIK